MTFPQDDATKQSTALFYDGGVGVLAAIAPTIGAILPTKARTDSMHKIPAGDVKCISYPAGAPCPKLTDSTTELTDIDEMVSANERFYDLLKGGTYTIPSDQSMLSTATITVHLPANALLSANGEIFCVQSPKPNACHSIPTMVNLMLPTKKSDPMPDLQAQYVFVHEVIALARSLQK